MTRFAEYLATLPADRLAELLAARPDALAEPAPRTLGELASRLETAVSVRRAISAADTHATVIAQVVTVLDSGFFRKDVEAFTPGHEDDANSALDRLIAMGVVLPRTVGARAGDSTPPTEAPFDAVPTLGEVFPFPLGLGPSLRELLPLATVAALQRQLRMHAAPEDGSKPELVARLTALLSTPEVLHESLALAPPDTLPLLESALRDPVVELDYDDLRGDSGWGHAASRTPPPFTPAAFLKRAGILQPLGYEHAVLPREVALALRGGSLSLVLPPEPGPLATVPIDAEKVDQAGAAAASAFLDGVRVVLETCAATPPAAVKAGGIGVREVRRLAKELRRSEEELGLLFTTAAAAGLVDTENGEVLPTPAYDEWKEAEPGLRYAVLVAAWWRLLWTPGQVDEYEGKVNLLGPRPLRGDAPFLRHTAVGSLATLPVGRAAVSLDAVVDAIHWRTPAAVPANLAAHATAMWHEATLLGVVAESAATSVGRALAAGSAGGLMAAARAFVPAATAVATFQADLTAIVAGTPAADLSALLGSAADVESRGAATVWRFGPVSVRRAMDAGTSADTLIADLESVATRLPLPQPLTYLIRDVARRHGNVRVMSVACCLVSTDEALLAEVVRTRSLSKLRLRTLAPTVLASTRSVEETLELLRQNGFAPVREDDTGQVMLERAESRRSPSQTGPGTTGLDVLLPPIESRVTAAELQSVAVALTQTSTIVAPPEQVNGIYIDAHLPAQIGADGVRVLAHAAETGGPIQIRYEDSRGNVTDRVVSRVRWMGGDSILAWCHLRNDDRFFTASGLQSVVPVE